MTPNQSLADRLLRARVRSIGYGHHVADEVLRFLDASEPAIKRVLLEIFAVPSAHTGKRLREAESRVLRIRGAAWNKLSEQAISALVSLAWLEPKILKQAIGAPLEVPAQKRMATIAKTALVAGHNLKEWFATLKQADLKRIVGQLRIGILSGETLPKTIARITGKLSTVMTAAKNAVRQVIHTAVGPVVQATRTEIVLGSLAGLAAANMAVEWERWVSVLDSRTSPGCVSLSGKLLRVGVPPFPGYHQNCRSERVPVIEGGGDVEMSTYAVWIESQPTAFRKYAGEAPFTASNLRPLSLDELLEDDE